MNIFILFALSEINNSQGEWGSFEGLLTTCWLNGRSLSKDCLVKYWRCSRVYELYWINICLEKQIWNFKYKKKLTDFFTWLLGLTVRIANPHVCSSLNVSSLVLAERLLRQTPVSSDPDSTEQVQIISGKMHTLRFIWTQDKLPCGWCLRLVFTKTMFPVIFFNVCRIAYLKFKH